MSSHGVLSVLVWERLQRGSTTTGAQRLASVEPRARTRVQIGFYLGWFTFGTLADGMRSESALVLVGCVPSLQPTWAARRVIVAGLLWHQLSEAQEKGQQEWRTWRT